MKALEEKILKEGVIAPGHILKVGSFFNQQMDVPFMMEMGKEMARLFADEKVDKVLTIEASGIAFGIAAAYHLGAKLVFAKKKKSANINNDVYTASVYSYTYKQENTIMVDKEFLIPGERILIVDDFLANGEALSGLIDLVKNAGAEVVGCCTGIEKGFQGGGDRLRAKGVRVESLAIIEEMTDDTVIFRH